MNHDNITSTSRNSRERLIQMLNKDLAIEYQAIIAFIVYSQVLKRASYADIALELEQHAAEDFQYARQIARQINSLGGSQAVRLNTDNPPNEPVAMLLSGIVENLEHEIDLASLLDIGLTNTHCPVPGNSPKPRSTRVSPISPKTTSPNQNSVRRNPAKRGARSAGASAISQPA